MKGKLLFILLILLSREGFGQAQHTAKPNEQVEQYLDFIKAVPFNEALNQKREAFEKENNVKLNIAPKPNSIDKTKVSKLAAILINILDSSLFSSEPEGYINTYYDINTTINTQQHSIEEDVYFKTTVTEDLDCKFTPQVITDIDANILNKPLQGQGTDNLGKISETVIKGIDAYDKVLKDNPKPCSNAQLLSSGLLYHHAIKLAYSFVFSGDKASLTQPIKVNENSISSYSQIKDYPALFKDKKQKDKLNAFLASNQTGLKLELMITASGNDAATLEQVKSYQVYSPKTIAVMAHYNLESSKLEYELRYSADLAEFHSNPSKEQAIHEYVDQFMDSHNAYQGDEETFWEMFSNHLLFCHDFVKEASSVGVCLQEGLERGMREKELSMISFTAGIQTWLCLTTKEKCLGEADWKQFSYGFANGLAEQFDVAAIRDAVIALVLQGSKNQLSCLTDIESTVQGLVTTTDPEEKLQMMLKCSFGLDISLEDIKTRYALASQYVEANIDEPYFQGQATAFVVTLVLTELKVIQAAKAAIITKVKGMNTIAVEAAHIEQLANAADNLDDLKRVVEELKGVKATIKSIDEIKHLLKTERNTGCFWSGKTNGIGGELRALEIAENKGGITLEGLVKKQKIQLPPFDASNSSVVKLWEDVSTEYAKQASGEVRAIIGKQLREGNVWETKELPALMANPNVTKITTIDPETLLETVIFVR